MAHVIASESFWVAASKGGRERLIRAGEVLDDGDPIVKANRGKFLTPDAAAKASAPPSFSAVERATAAPGELRDVKRK